MNAQGRMYMVESFSNVSPPLGLTEAKSGSQVSIAADLQKLTWPTSELDLRPSRARRHGLQRSSRPSTAHPWTIHRETSEANDKLPSRRAAKATPRRRR